MQRSERSYLQSRWGFLFLVFSAFLLLSGIASAANVIKIGISGPMKFPAGENMYIGAQLAAEEINAKGGIDVGGKVYKIEIVKVDSNEYLSVPDAVSGLERLLTVDKVNFVIGGARSEAILAQQEVMAENKTIYIMSGGGSPKLTEQVEKNYDKYKYFFRTTTPHTGYQLRSLSAALDAVAQKIRKDLGIQKPKVALVMEKILTGDAMIAVAQDVVPKLGMEIVGIWRPSPTSNDMSAELSAVKSSGAQIIMTLFTGPAGIIFGKQWGELEIPALPIGTNIEAQLLKYWTQTAGKCEYEMVLNPVVRADIGPKTIPIFDKFVKNTGDYPFYTAMGAYDGVYLLTAAAQRAKSLDNDKVVVELEKTDYAGVAGRIVFNARNEPLPHDLKYGAKYSTIFVQQWQKGKLVTVWPDGNELNPAIGAGTGWKGIKFPGTVEAVLPPVMIKYWKRSK
jgi:branched-chain amino acid transport system substrate-binding protein